MRILHTEASPGWGGQEIRILREMEGMRERGHEVVLAVQRGGGLVEPARASGFLVYEIPFTKKALPYAISQLAQIIRKERIEIINTHSSLDAWLGGILGKILGCRVIRTRHLSTPIRKGMNSRILYNWLADAVVTTCEDAAEMIQNQAKLSTKICQSIPTGVNPSLIHFDEKNVLALKEKWGVGPEDFLVGTLCILRTWKGISVFLQAAKLLEHIPHLKWVIIGAGVSEEYFRNEWKALGLENKVIFAGHLSPPYDALAALDLFLLLSWANEGVSQASLQAAWLKKPLITTTIGGLKEVCLENKTGLQVPVHDAKAVADAVLRLMGDPSMRKKMGEEAKMLVESKFTLTHTLDQMEQIYKKIVA